MIRENCQLFGTGMKSALLDGVYGIFCVHSHITVVHLHNGILCSGKKEGAPTLCDSLGGAGEHYAK